MKKQKKQAQFKYIADIESYLIKQYGVINNEWRLTIDLLKDNIELYNRCKESIDRNGIYDVESGRKNPLIATLKDLQATIIKQIQHLGLTPYAASKINPHTEDNEEDYINELVK